MRCNTYYDSCVCGLFWMSFAVLILSKAVTSVINGAGGSYLGCSVLDIPVVTGGAMTCLYSLQVAWRLQAQRRPAQCFHRDEASDAVDFESDMRLLAEYLCLFATPRCPTRPFPPLSRLNALSSLSAVLSLPSRTCRKLLWYSILTTLALLFNMPLLPWVVSCKPAPFASLGSHILLRRLQSSNVETWVNHWVCFNYIWFSLIYVMETRMIARHRSLLSIL